MVSILINSKSILVRRLRESSLQHRVDEFELGCLGGSDAEVNLGLETVFKSHFHSSVFHLNRAVICSLGVQVRSVRGFRWFCHGYTFFRDVPLLQQLVSQLLDRASHRVRVCLCIAFPPEWLLPLSVNWLSNHGVFYQLKQILRVVCPLTLFLLGLYLFKHSGANGLLNNIKVQSESLLFEVVDIANLGLQVGVFFHADGLTPSAQSC